MYFYTNDDINRMNQYRHYLCNRYNYLILSSDRKTKKTEFLVEYAIKSTMVKDTKILFLVNYEKEKDNILKIFSRNIGYRNSKINSVNLINGSIIIVDTKIPRGHNFDIILIDDVHELYTKSNKMKDEFNIMYKYITKKVIMYTVKDYGLFDLPDEFDFFTVDKNTSIGLLRSIKIGILRSIKMNYTLSKE